MQNSFWDWYISEAEKHKGLVNLVTAADLLGISVQHLNRIIETTDRITKIYYEKRPYIGIDEIYEEHERRRIKEIQNEEPNVHPFIYPYPEYMEWSKEFWSKLEPGRNIPSEEQAAAFMDKKLKEWKKNADPERVELLKRRVEQVAKGKYKSVDL